MRFDLSSLDYDHPFDIGHVRHTEKKSKAIALDIMGREEGLFIPFSLIFDIEQNEHGKINNLYRQDER